MGIITVSCSLLSCAVIRVPFAATILEANPAVLEDPSCLLGVDQVRCVLAAANLAYINVVCAVLSS